MVYQAIVTSNNPKLKEKIHYGVTETPFTLRYAKHTKSFNMERYKKNTELSKEVWKIKEANLTPIVKWKMIK